jgi:hypothetical protein
MNSTTLFFNWDSCLSLMTCWSLLYISCRILFKDLRFVPYFDGLLETIIEIWHIQTFFPPNMAIWVFLPFKKRGKKKEKKKPLYELHHTFFFWWYHCWWIRFGFLTVSDRSNGSDLDLNIIIEDHLSAPAWHFFYWWGKFSPNFDLKKYDFNLYERFFMDYKNGANSPDFNDKF